MTDPQQATSPKLRSGEVPCIRCLACAPEIASAMLQRQYAGAVVAKKFIFCYLLPLDAERQ